MYAVGHGDLEGKFSHCRMMIGHNLPPCRSECVEGIFVGGRLIFSATAIGRFRFPRSIPPLLRFRLERHLQSLYMFKHEHGRDARAGEAEQFPEFIFQQTPAVNSLFPDRGILWSGAWAATRQSSLTDIRYGYGAEPLQLRIHTVGSSIRSQSGSQPSSLSVPRTLRVVGFTK